MITKLKFNNCFAFNKEVIFSMKADMRTKKFPCNVISVDDKKILKSAVIYGPNNTGKTSIINCVKVIKKTLLNKYMYVKSNIFNDSNICEFGISFIYNDKEFSYEYKYDSNKKEYIYEKFSEILFDKYSNEKEDLIYVKDTINKIYDCPKDQKLKELLSLTSKNNILIYTIEIENFIVLQYVKEVLTSIANKIEIVDMNEIPIEKTIEMLKNNDDITKKTVDFIKKADIYLDDYKFIDEIDFDIDAAMYKKILNNNNINEQIKLVSVYKGKQVPSLIYDSLGTRKFASLASYIIDSLTNNKILFVDELDSSLHFKISRAIISMFNNDINKNSQLVCTLHDISLLDCKKMFRKEQIWFTDKDENQTLIYSLKEFSYNESGIRETTDIKEKYSKGIFGAIPDPDLISTLLEVD